MNTDLIILIAFLAIALPCLVVAGILIWQGMGVVDDELNEDFTDDRRYDE